MGARTTTGGGAPALPAAGFFLLAAVSLFWGLNWPGMKIVLNEMTIWWFRALSVGVGAAGLLLIARATSGRFLPTRREVWPTALCALFNIVGWHLLTGYGVSQMAAGRASIIAFTMPVWAALLGTAILGERMTGFKIAGLALGVAGLLVLIGPELANLSAAPLGAAFMLGAAVSWAIGTVLFKKFAWDSPVALLIGWQLAVGFAAILPGALLLEPLPRLGELSREAWIALLYLFALPMVFCQWAFFQVVRIFPAAIASIGTLAVPAIGVWSSALLLGEPTGWREAVSMALIVAALATVLVLPALSGGTGRGSAR